MEDIKLKKAWFIQSAQGSLEENYDYDDKKVDHFDARNSVRELTAELLKACTRSPRLSELSRSFLKLRLKTTSVSPLRSIFSRLW